MMEPYDLAGIWDKPPEGGRPPVSNEQFIDNVRKNIVRPLPNLPSVRSHDRIMIMVCGGPTAGMLLDEIREKSEQPQYDIFSSNQTHDWLIGNDIIPDYQFIIDPKPNKIEDVRNPHKDVKYLIACQCDPSVFDALEGYNVTRIFCPCGLAHNGIRDVDVIKAMLPPDQINSISGGTMAGLRAMVLGEIMGYRTVEFYGFDSCYFQHDKTGNPIYYSYDKKRVENIIEARTDDGKIYLSSPVFASQARQFLKWKDRLGWVKFIIHGDGLTAHLDRLDDQEKEEQKVDGFYSDFHLQMTKELYGLYPEEEPGTGYGTTGFLHVPQITMMAGQLLKKHGPLTLLDYGCGRGLMAESLPPLEGLTVKMYDPAIEEHSALPEPADMVVCTDVLEHIEPAYLDNVLDHLQGLTKKLAFVAINLLGADKCFSDGRNVHLILCEPDFWFPRFRKRFDIAEWSVAKDGSRLITVLQSKEMRDMETEK
jgi:hypothetical protein